MILGLSISLSFMHPEGTVLLHANISMLWICLHEVKEVWSFTTRIVGTTVAF